MRTPAFWILFFLSGLAIVRGAEPSRFFAAVGMTKAQKNSSVPTDSGLYVRAASGEWHHFGPRILGISSVVAQPGNPEVLLIASSDGVIRSSNGGRAWRKTTGWEVIDVKSIAFDRNQPQFAYAATQWGPLRSSDAGATWTLAQAGLPTLYTQTVIADRANAGRVLIGSEAGIYLSTDAAVRWTRVPSPETTILRLAQSEVDAKLMIAGTQHQGAWLSRDGGLTWSATDPASAGANLYAVALDRKDPRVIAVGGWNVGVRVSIDGGVSWVDRTAGLPVPHAMVLAFDPDVTGRLWASIFEESAYFSDDLGRTWKSGGLDGAYGYDFSFLPPVRR